MTDVVLSNDVVYGVRRCAHCSVAKPLMTCVQKPTLHYKGDYLNYFYFTASCSHCHHLTLFYAESSDNDVKSDMEVKTQYPHNKQADDELPERAKNFLKQAYESKHAPDGCLMLAASSIDAMLKDKGYIDGSLYKRIEDAATANFLTAEMSEWAHEIRLNANEPRHADDSFDGATTEDAEQVLQFASALSQYLYVLPSKVKKWKAKKIDR